MLTCNSNSCTCRFDHRSLLFGATSQLGVSQSVSQSDQSGVDVTWTKHHANKKHIQYTHVYRKASYAQRKVTNTLEYSGVTQHSY